MKREVIEKGDCFAPRVHTMTVLYPDSRTALASEPLFREEGIDPDHVEIRTCEHNESHSHMDDPNNPPTPWEEIKNAAEESFSDDEKLSRRIERHMEAGGVACSFFLDRSIEARADLARRLRDNGATAVYYWGAWTTEQL